MEIATHEVSETRAAKSVFNDEDKSNTKNLDCGHTDNTNVEKVKLTKEEKKALYRPLLLPEPYNTWRKVLFDIWSSDDAKKVKVSNRINVNCYLLKLHFSQNFHAKA